MLITQPGFKMQGRQGLGWGESVRGSDPVMLHLNQLGTQGLRALTSVSATSWV